MSFFGSIGRALKSRTVWAGIGTTALGVSEIAAQYAPVVLSFVPPATPLAAGITAGLGVATIIGRVRAKQPIGPVIDKTITDTVKAVHEIQDKPAPTPGTLAMVKEIVRGSPLVAGAR